MPLSLVRSGSSRANAPSSDPQNEQRARGASPLDEDDRSDGGAEPTTIAGTSGATATGTDNSAVAGASEEP